MGEVCFNTAMTGYQEVMTDPSYAAQIVTFTFPHIGNVGANDEDLEIAPGGCAGARGASCATIHRRRPTSARAAHFDEWLKAQGIIGLCRASIPAR